MVECPSSGIHVAELGMRVGVMQCHGMTPILRKFRLAADDDGFLPRRGAENALGL